MTTKPEVLAMAEQADIIYVGLDGNAIANCDSGSDITEEILKFHAATYALAFDAGRKAEREECAKVCDSLADGILAEKCDTWPESQPNAVTGAEACALTIRARSAK